MSFIVVILLAGLWALLLLPGMFRAHRSSSPRSSVDDFDRSMVVLANTRHRAGGSRIVALPDSPPSPPRPAAEAARRRRAVLLWLGAATLVSALFAVLGVSLLWPVAGLFAVATLAYVGMAVLVVRRQELQRERVRRLPTSPSFRETERADPAPGRMAAGWPGPDLAVESERLS
ncbi:MAG: hypothetical protein ACR2MA_02810 [Egibacteraceae bacterium]